MRAFLSFSFTLTLAATLQAQVSSSAYRTLGQPNLSQSGANLIRGLELFESSPGLFLGGSVALDSRNGATHIYIADLGNSRVLGWTDTASYQIGDPPAVILGQQGPQFSALMGIGVKGLNQPWGMAVDPASGNLYVADAGNNRILRFPAPFSNLTNYTPDAVIGQPGFAGTQANPPGNSATGLSSPEALAFDTAGNLWVADTGNNRVVRFPAAVLNGQVSPQADIVLGQKDFNLGAANAGGGISALGFSAPRGIALDAQNNLYVADFQNGRVLRFASPIATNQAAGVVIGQASFSAHVIIGPPNPLTNHSMAGPVGIAITPTDTLYVAVPGENRVLMFPVGSAATVVYGQGDFTSSTPNFDSRPSASPNGLWAPTDIKLDANGNVYVVDAGNNRALMYLSGSRSANSVWGQAAFTGNGINQIKPTSVNTPYKATIDYSQSPYPLYLSDSANHRILVWKDSVNFHNGDPADLAIGQPDLFTAVANVDNVGQTPTATSLAAPRGIAVDQSGNLYVADFGNNRVLRYPRPVDQQGRITPDIVLGQSNFTTSSVAIASASSLNGPSAVAIGPGGEVFISDTGNNRVLQFSANPASGASAIQVYGQSNFNSNAAITPPTPQTLVAPRGLFVDPAYNLYVVDSGANRVVIYPNVQSNPTNGRPAQVVLGQALFTSGASGTGGASLNGPLDVVVDSTGSQYSIYVSDTANSRVQVFPSLALSAQEGQTASGGLGGCNGATPTAVCFPTGVFLDRKNTLYVADAGNNRLVQFLKASAVVNGASFAASTPVAPGSAASFFIAPNSIAQTSDGTAPLPPSLSGLQLVVNDASPAPLYHAGGGQINFQVPSGAPPGQNRIAMKDANTGELIAGGIFSVAVSGPGLFTAAASGTGQGAIINQDGVTSNGVGHAAPRGSVVSLYGTGQGAVNTAPFPLDGQAALASPLSYSVTVPAADPQGCLAQTAICVGFQGGGNIAYGTVQFSGLAPGWVGLWQINVQIPSNAPTGNAVQVFVSLGPIRSNVVTMAIQ